MPVSSRRRCTAYISQGAASLRSSLPKDQLSGAQEPHSQPHVQAQTEFSKKKLAQMEVLRPFPSKLSSPSTTPLPGKTVQRATCGPKPASSLSPWEAPACFVRPQERRSVSAPGRPSEGSSYSRGGPGEKLGLRKEAPWFSWPQTLLLCCVSVFMKCFSNKVSVPRRVRTLIKCRTCAVCQLAVEAYLNSFSDMNCSH